MEPGFYRGDILFLNMGKSPIRTGEIVVFNLKGRDIPIVHRVIKVRPWLRGGCAGWLAACAERYLAGACCCSFGLPRCWGLRCA